MKRYCLALDQRGDLSQYIHYHDNIWPEIVDSLRESGILHLEIYHVADRFVMILETTDDFSFERKAALDAANPKVQEWEALMSQFQQRIAGVPSEEKWAVMDRIFELGER